MLHGIAQAMADQIRMRWELSATRGRQESLDRIGAAQGDKQLQQAYAHGIALGFDQAIDLALQPVPAIW